MQQGVGIHDHARRAKAALEGIMGHEGLLKGMETTVAAQPLDGQDLLALNIIYGRLAGSNGHIIDKHRAGPAIGFSASVFCPGQSKIGPQNPQEHPIGIHI
jgi:hypothetical protein